MSKLIIREEAKTAKGDENAYGKRSIDTEHSDRAAPSKAIASKNDEGSMFEGERV